MKGRKTTPIEIRFKRHFRVDENGCWIWTGTSSGSGYGMIGLGAKVLGKDLAHRVSWRIHHGEIPSGLLVLHRCDIRRCVNPDHLFLGSYKDNSADMTAKGRGLTGTKRTPDKITRGSVHGMAKLTEIQVAEIKRRHVAKPTFHRILASEFGVSRATIANILTGKNWSHV